MPTDKTVTQSSCRLYFTGMFNIYCISHCHFKRKLRNLEFRIRAKDFKPYIPKLLAIDNGPRNFVNVTAP